jgi:molybdate transport repressor ModE-like protein
VRVTGAARADYPVFAEKTFPAFRRPLRRKRLTEHELTAVRHAAHWRGIELRHLEALATIVSEGSFSRAARRLGYSQSAISQQVAALERIVGHRVLERSSGAQAVIPTAVGKIVLEHGEQIARQIASARAEVEAFAATGESVLRIGASPLANGSLLALGLGRLRANAPEVVVDVVEAQRDSDLLADVAAGRLDAAFVHGPIEQSELDHHVLYADQFGVYVGGRARQLERPLTISELERTPFVGLSRSEPFERALETLRADGIALRVVVRTSSLAALCGLVAQGAAAALLPQSVATPEMHAREVELALPTRIVAIAWRRVPAPRPTVEQFIAAAQAAASAFRRTRGLAELAA